MARLAGGSVPTLLGAVITRRLPREGELTVFMGGVDGFRRVACNEPHTGEVVAVLKAGTDLPGPLEQIFGAYTGEELARSELGVVLMNPFLPEEKVPTGVEGVFVIAHPAGLWLGSVKRGSPASE